MSVWDKAARAALGMSSVITALTVRVDTDERGVHKVRVLGIPVWTREGYERRRTRRAERRARRKK